MASADSGQRVAHSDRESLRVLIVITSDARRGAEIEGERLGRELRSAPTTVGAVDVVALAAGWDGADVRTVEDARGGRVGSLGRLRATASRIGRPLTRSNPDRPSPAGLDVALLGPTPRSPTTLLNLRRRARRADVVVAFGSTTLPACAVALVGTGTPFVYRSIGDPEAWAPTGWRRRRTAALMRRAAMVVSLWPGGEAAIQRVYGVAPSRTTSIPNTRSAEEFHPATDIERADARSRFGFVASTKVVGWIGAFSPEKRLGLAIDSVAQVDGAHLVVVGDGPDRPAFERRARSALGDRVTFLGTLADVRPVYAAADVLLSTSSTEGMPGVLIEAGLSGVPVVATAVGAVPWLFDHGLVGECVEIDDDSRGTTALVSSLNGQLSRSSARLALEWPDTTNAWIDILRAGARVHG